MKAQQGPEGKKIIKPKMSMHMTQSPLCQLLKSFFLTEESPLLPIKREKECEDSNKENILAANFVPDMKKETLNFQPSWEHSSRIGCRSSTKIVPNNGRKEAFRCLEDSFVNTPEKKVTQWAGSSIATACLPQTIRSPRKRLEKRT